MDKLSDLINNNLLKHNISVSIGSVEIIHFVNEFLEKDLDVYTNNAKAYKFKDNILYIGTKNSTWSQEIFFMQEKIINSLKIRFPNKSVNKILIKNLTIN